jgi:hypothetical protein
MFGSSALRKCCPSYPRRAANWRAAINRSVRRLSSRPVRHPKSDQGPRPHRRRSRCFRPCISWKADCRTSSRYRPSRHSDPTPSDNLGRLCLRTRRTPGWRGSTKRLLWKVATSQQQSTLCALTQSSQIWRPKEMEPLPVDGCDSYLGPPNRRSLRSCSAKGRPHACVASTGC